MFKFAVVVFLFAALAYVSAEDEKVCVRRVSQIIIEGVTGCVKGAITEASKILDWSQNKLIPRIDATKAISALEGILPCVRQIFVDVKNRQ